MYINIKVFLWPIFKFKIQKRLIRFSLNTKSNAVHFTRNILGHQITQELYKRALCLLLPNLHQHSKESFCY